MLQMGVYMMMAPLHTQAAGEWIALATSRYGIPLQTPPERDLPTIEQVLSAFHRANCHGWPWFRLRGLEGLVDPPPCTDAALCHESGGLHLGEVGLQIDDGGTSRWTQSTLDEFEPDSPVMQMQFRNPTREGMFAAASALAPQAGPLVVYDDYDTVFVVSADDDPSRMTEQWARVMGS